MTPSELHATNNADPKHPMKIAQDQLVAATLYRAIFSRRQLRERMVEFWTYHFNMDLDKADLLKTVDDRDVIRPHSLGTFSDLLHASAHSPAMLKYLDNANSQKAHPNQNYARELMELHTLGVNGGYTQQDVVEVARCFTGWTYGMDSKRADYGTFAFNPKHHDDGAKTVLGHAIPAGGGIKDGAAVLDILAKHDSTATFISTKLAHWLLRYDPSQALVASTAQVYKSTGGDIKQMIRQILTPDNLKAAPAKYKRPFHLLVSALRATNATVLAPESLDDGPLQAEGQKLFGWTPPNGYPDILPFWAGLLLPRWDGAFQLLDKHNGYALVDVTSLIAAKTATNITAAIDQALFAGEIPSKTLAALVAYLGASPSESTIREAVALALASSNFQYY